MGRGGPLGMLVSASRCSIGSQYNWLNLAIFPGRKGNKPFAHFSWEIRLEQALTEIRLLSD